MSAFEFAELCDEVVERSLSISHWEPVPGNVGYLVDFFIAKDRFVYVGAELFEGLWLVTAQGEGRLMTAHGTRAEIASQVASFVDNINAQP